MDSPPDAVVGADDSGLVIGENVLDSPAPPGYPDGGAWVLKQFGDGPAHVWEIGLPKLDDWPLRSVVYLFGSVQDARANRVEDPNDFREDPSTGKAKAASGCVFQVGSRKRPHLYVVTNGHVINEGCVKPRFSFKDPNGEYDYVIDAVEGDWHCNLLSTDLAVLPVLDETLAKNIGGVHSSIHRPFGLAIGDDVAMPGRFYPASGGARNRPVTRFGNIAVREPVEVLLPWIDSVQEVILVEMRSHSGYSGSPAFVFEGVGRKIERLIHEMVMNHQHPEEIDWPTISFLGIDCGHIAEQMAAIIPWFKVNELLESEVLVKQRQERDAEAPPMVIPDMQKPESDEFRRFRDLARGLVSVPKAETDKEERKWRKQRKKAKAED